MAVNLYTIRVDKGPAGEFFRKLNSQFVQYQTIFQTLPGFDITSGNLVPGVAGPGPELQVVTIGH